MKQQNKIYVSDAAMRNEVLMNNDLVLDPDELGIIAVTVVYKHIKAFYYNRQVQVGYYRDGSRGKEIDIVVKLQKNSIMIEVKYRESSEIKENDGIVVLTSFNQPNLVITKRDNDFGIKTYGDKRIYKIPAFAFIYLLGLMDKYGVTNADVSPFKLFDFQGGLYAMAVSIDEDNESINKVEEKVCRWIETTNFELDKGRDFMFNMPYIYEDGRNLAYKDIEKGLGYKQMQRYFPIKLKDNI